MAIRWSIVAIATAVIASGCAARAGSSSAPTPLPAVTSLLCGQDPEPVPCVDTAGGDPMPTPVGQPHDVGGNCVHTFSADRCQALGAAAARELGLGFDDIASVDVVPDPDPPPGGIDFGHHTYLEVGIRGRDGHESVSIACPGISAGFDPPCMPEPQVPVGYPGGVVGSGGYLDVPDGSTPFPSLEPAAVASAKPLRVPRLVVRVDRVGPATIDLGSASLPNGYLTEGHVALADAWPSSVLFAEGIQLVVRPKGGGDPIWNLYETGWHRGTFDVDVTLTYDVSWFEPGASFTLTDIIVR